MNITSTSPKSGPIDKKIQITGKRRCDDNPFPSDKRRKMEPATAPTPSLPLSPSSIFSEPNLPGQLLDKSTSQPSNQRFPRRGGNSSGHVGGDLNTVVEKFARRNSVKEGQNATKAALKMILAKEIIYFFIKPYAFPLPIVMALNSLWVRNFVPKDGEEIDKLVKLVLDNNLAKPESQDLVESYKGLVKPTQKVLACDALVNVALACAGLAYSLTGHAGEVDDHGDKASAASPLAQPQVYLPLVIALLLIVAKVGTMLPLNIDKHYCSNNDKGLGHNDENHDAVEAIKRLVKNLGHNHWLNHHVFHPLEEQLTGAWSKVTSICSRPHINITKVEPNSPEENV